MRLLRGLRSRCARPPPCFFEIGCEAGAGAATSAGAAGGCSKAKLIEAYGPDVALSDLRTTLAKCERAGGMSNPCGAIT